jgi:uncharacterized membrane protein
MTGIPIFQLQTDTVGAREVLPRSRAARMMFATSGLLAVGLALQLAVFAHGGHTALSDLPRVFLHRGVGPGAFPYVDRATEYPVGSGLLLYVAALTSPSALGVLLVTACASAALCLAIGVALERRVGRRAWRWALAVPVLLYAFQNWDVFAIAALLAGLLAFERRRDWTAGAAFGLGAAVKLFPAIVLPPLIAVRLARGDRRGAVRLAASSAIAFVAVNLPVLLANPSGWWWPTAFQSRRNATWGSAWFYLFRLGALPVHGATGARLANVVSLVALMAAVGWLTVVTMRRRLPPLAAAGAAVAIFILCNKVYSPTYDLWLVVFFVLLPLSSRLWATFCGIDLAVFITVYGHFHGLDSTQFVRVVLPVLVAVRTVVLLIILFISTRPLGRADTRSHGTATARAGLAR